MSAQQNNCHANAPVLLSLPITSACFLKYAWRFCMRPSSSHFQSSSYRDCECPVYTCHNVLQALHQQVRWIGVHGFAQVSQALAPRVHDCFHLPDTKGSDHCPAGIVLALPIDAPAPAAAPAVAAAAEATATAVAVPAGGGDPVVKSATATAVAVAVTHPAVAASAPA